MNPTFKITTSASDPAETLQVTATVPTTQTIFQGSIKQLKDRIAAYDTEMAALQNKQAADQALLAQIEGVFATAGVKDTTTALSPDLVTAIETQNDEANTAALEAQSAAITTALTPVAPAITL